MEIQIDLQHLIFWRAGAWCLWNQAQEAEHLAAFGRGEDMMFINDLCGEQDWNKI